MLTLKKILCPTDFSEPSYAALQTAGELAQLFASELLVIHVIPPVPIQYPFPDPPVSSSDDEALFQQQLALAVEDGLKGVLAQRVPREVRTFATVLTGDPAAEIVREAAAEHADLIVIATHGQTGWRHLVFGSVAEQVLRLAACPVLTLRAPKSGE